ncbi:MAG: type II toxin-antitoxin system YafQ family toxin [Cryomorphaceae bacterium]|nr:type II toxin-antitoxin system YafQ family toxin [Cryomorphaceae bacterium]
MYRLDFTNQFKKDYKRAKKRGLDLSKFTKAANLLKKFGALDAPKYKTHPLKGNYSGFLDSHLQPDWVLIWYKKEAEKSIVLVRMGSHADLF